MIQESLYPRKCILVILLKGAGIIDAKPYKLPIDQHVKLLADIGTLLPDPEVYRRLIGKLIYHTTTRSDSLLKDQGIKDLGHVDLKFTNQPKTYIAANHVFYVGTKQH